MLPNEGTILGKLEYLEIYGYYDFPIFFSCKNEKDEVYLGIWVDESENNYTFLFALIEDSSILVLLERDLKPADFYIYHYYKTYKVEMFNSTVTEATKEEVESYFSEYIENVKKDQKLFTEMLQEIDEKLKNNN
jgi:hypothetical protein